MLITACSPAATPQPQPSNGPCSKTAADTLGWGTTTNRSEVADKTGLDGWTVYDSVGHGGNGRRTPGAVSVRDGELTITGDAQGNSGGMSWWPGRTYGRWEVCAKAAPGSANYHPVLLLWPDSNRWPAEGEIDFMEIWDPTRQTVTATVHHLNADDPAVTWGPADHASVQIDATQWHSWSVEWAPDAVTGYVDGVQWFRLTDHVPRSSMHLCIQLDDFGGDISQGGTLTAAWARQYSIPD